MMGRVCAPTPAVPPVRSGIMFWFCLTCERIATDGKCRPNDEIAAIPPPPFDARLN
jgi:hypothetical protein